MHLNIVHVDDSSRVHLYAEITSTEHSQSEMVQIQYFINIVDCVGCFKFTSEITLIVILFAHYFYKMFYIFGCAKIRHHDIIDVFKTEYITSKFDTFSVMVGNTINTKRAITYTDSFASTDDKSVIS